MKLEELVLHPAARTLLTDFQKTPAHAILLAGPAGIGKTHVAQALAAQLLGLAPHGLENAAYYRAVQAEKGSISIDQIRTLIKFFRLAVPGTAAIKRTAVIMDAEMMGREAQNALLKLLEEPPQGSVLILTTSAPDQLLPTIRSRTQTLMLPAPLQADLTDYLATKGYSTPDIQRTLLRTGGNVAQALQLLGATGDGDTTLSLVKQVLGGTPYDRMLLVDGLAKQKDQAAAFVATLAATASASLQAAAAKNPGALPRWQAILQAADTAGNALERSGNAKLVFTELMLAL